MKVFISWSGERSKSIAESLRYWLPKVIQAVHPWMSKEDISSGSRWSSEIYKELEETRFGIICVTPENQHNPWIMFESGALSKSIDQTYVVPYLFDMEANQLSGPLVQFQANKTSKEGTFSLLSSINQAIGDRGLSESELEEVFEVWWNKLELKLNYTPKYKIEKKDTRTDRDILNEILVNTREQLRKEEIRLNSMRNKDDGMTDVIHNLKTAVQNYSSPKLISDLLNQNGTTMDLLQQQNPFSKFDMPLDKMIEILDEQKNVTDELLEKKTIKKRTRKNPEK
jgi:hypothetical protein